MKQNDNVPDTVWRNHTGKPSGDFMHNICCPEAYLG